MLDLKSLRTQAKALGLKRYYRMNKKQLEYSLTFPFRMTNRAFFVPCENVDEADSGLLGTFSFDCFNYNGKRIYITFTLRKKDTRSATSEGINITDNHVRYFGESYIEFYDSQNETVFDYFPYIDIIKFRLAWQQKYRQDNSIKNDFACEYALRELLNEILKFAGYLDDKGNFIHDGNGAFRIHAWNFLAQNDNNILENFIMPDVPFSDENNIDNPLTWINDKPARNDALRAYFSLLYTEDNARSIKEYFSNDEGIFDSFIQELRDRIQRLHFVYSDIDKAEAMTYKKAVQAIVDVLSSNYDSLNNPLGIMYRKPDVNIYDDIVDILRKCTNTTIIKISGNNIAPLYVVSSKRKGESAPSREKEISSLATNLIDYAIYIAIGRIKEESILQKYYKYKLCGLWVKFIESKAGTVKSG